MALTGAVTLAQEIALRRDKMEKGILKTLVEVSPFGRRIPFQTTGALSIPITYLSGIPSAQFRLINEAVVAQSADFATRVETLYIMDSDIDIDPVLLANKNQIQRIDVAQTQAKVQAIAYDLVDYAVNGDPDTNIRQPIGLKKKLDSDALFSGQTVELNTASAVEFDLRVGQASFVANFQTFLHQLNTAFARIDDKPDCLLTNNQMILTIWAGLMQANLYNQSADQYEKEVMTYRGVPIIDAKWKASAAIDGTFDAGGASANQVIGNDATVTSTVNATNGSSNGTPVYLVRFGDDYYTGLQQEPMKVTKLGQIHDSPHPFRTNILWVFHPAAAFQKRSMARLAGAAVTSAPA